MTNHFHNDIKRILSLKLAGGTVIAYYNNLLLVVGWFFQPYLDLEAGDNQSLKIQVARPGIESLTTRPPLLPICSWSGKFDD